MVLTIDVTGGSDLASSLAEDAISKFETIVEKFSKSEPPCSVKATTSLRGQRYEPLFSSLIAAILGGCCSPVARPHHNSRHSTARRRRKTGSRRGHVSDVENPETSACSRLTPG
jgi:hypothetical protein